MLFPLLSAFSSLLLACFHLVAHLVGMLAPWEIRSHQYALLRSSLSVFSSFSTERARFSTWRFPLFMLERISQVANTL